MTIPSGDLFEMDDNPGLEQLLVIVSPKPLTNFTKTLEATSTKTRPERMQAQQAIRGELAQMAANAESAEPPLDARSIVIEDLPSPNANGGGTEAAKRGDPPAKPKPNQGAMAPKQASHPYLVELTLVHI